MGRARCAVILIAAMLRVAGALEAQMLQKVYDPGQHIEGMLMDRDLDIPISTPETGQHTDTEFVYALDGDHYVLLDQEGVQVGEGTDLDMIDKWSWSCTGSTVTQGSATTTWTSPDTGGCTI